ARLERPHVVVDVLDHVKEVDGVGPARLHDEIVREPTLAHVEAGGARRRGEVRMRLHAHRFAELGERGEDIAGAATELEETRASPLSPFGHGECARRERKSTLMNSSHVPTSYGVICLTKNTNTLKTRDIRFTY